MKKVNGVDVEFKKLQISDDLARSIQIGKFFSISELSSLALIKYVYVGRVNACRSGGCSIHHNDETDEESEYFDYFIFFDATATVQFVKIYNYQATHGQEVTSANWLKQFKNYNGKEELVAGKNIDAISGATISVDATTFDIELRTNTLRKIIQ
ncbi:MAG: FMN-binding protein [Paludibacter sp.]